MIKVMMIDTIFYIIEIKLDHLNSFSNDINKKKQTPSDVPVNPLNCLKDAVNGHVLIASGLNEPCKKTARYKCKCDLGSVVFQTCIKA